MEYVLADGHREIGFIRSTPSAHALTKNEQNQLFSFSCTVLTKDQEISVRIALTSTVCEIR